MNRPEQVPTHLKQILNDTVNMQEPLGVSRRGEAAHLTPLLARRLMGGGVPHGDAVRGPLHRSVREHRPGNANARCGASRQPPICNVSRPAMASSRISSESAAICCVRFTTACFGRGRLSNGMR